MVSLSVVELLILAVVGYQPPTLRATVALPSVQAVVTGNTVLATASVNEKGDVTNVQLLQGDQPFTNAVVEAVYQWQFQPALAGGSPVSCETAVLMIFRPPAFGNFGVGGPSLGFTPRPVPEGDHAVWPIYIADPTWPQGRFLNPGVVVLELDIRESGSIAGMRVVHDVPATSDFAKEAVSQWDFSPAVKDGRPIPSTIIIAISFVTPRVRH